MPRAPCSFRESDVRRAIRAARSSGIEVGRIEIGRDGRIVVVPGEPPEDGATQTRAASADEELARWRRKHASRT